MCFFLLQRSWPRQKDLVYMYREVESMMTSERLTSSVQEYSVQKDDADQFSRGDATHILSGDATADEPVTARLRTKTLKTVTGINKKRTRSSHASS
jgi:hypothetical protein